MKKEIIRILEARQAERWIRRDKFTALNPELEEQVRSIIEEVKSRGDEALISFTKKFDNVKLEISDLKVDREEIEKAYEKVTDRQIKAIEEAKKRLEIVEGKLLESLNTSVELKGIKIRFSVRPIESVGCYVPGGRAAYPSTLIMTTTPAKLAGVPRVTVCSPPAPDGTINPLILVSADICKVDEFYRVGGAQAIAAMAYGTETIAPVKKIVGPGNKYVTAAKILVSKDVAIDLPAGPSELLIIADENADPYFLALDLCSQAEHAPDSIVGLLTTSRRIAHEVELELEKLVRIIPRSEVVVEALSNGFIVVCENEDEMIEIANAFAPEHLEIITKNSEALVERIFTAGIVLIGEYSTVAISDYCCGTNHVLPTGGFGRVYSGLSALDFVKKLPIVEVSKEGLNNAVEYIRILAEAEGLLNHYEAVKGRLKNEELP
ncbi:MAG: histidinol dehydrogenase [Candidatus Bathyarchaeia archaeon]